MVAFNLTQLASVEVTLLAENTARGAGILGEHGLAWWIESEGRRLMFDLGQGLVIERNAERLKLDLSTAEAIVLSHGHYDHVGGLRAVSGYAGDATLFLHPDALKPKFQMREDGRVVSAGDDRFAGIVGQWGGAVVETVGPTQVLPGIWVTGAVPRETDYEDTGGAFCADSDGLEPDLIHDDQSLFFKTQAGMVVVLGCAHAGAINTLNYIHQLSETRIHAVIGGMHLVNADAVRLDQTIQALKAIAPDWIGPNHCTGDEASAALRMAFTPRCLECHAGQTLVFPKS